jgi:acetolactate synthase-1/3 small subunit
MTIVMTGQDGVVEQARRQLEDLVPVWTVLDYTDAVLMQRELLMAKINILGPEYFKELLANHQETPIDTDAENAHEAIEIPETTAVQPKMSRTEALKVKHEYLQSITYLAHQFGGKVLDIGTSSCIVEM